MIRRVLCKLSIIYLTSICVQRWQRKIDKALLFGDAHTEQATTSSQLNPSEEIKYSSGRSREEEEEEISHMLFHSGILSTK